MTETSGVPVASAPAVVKGVRRAAIIAIVAALAFAAVLGIITLLGGDFGELQGRVLLTTLVIAAFGTTALCHLAIITRRVRVVGFVGIAASAGAALCALVLTWIPWSASFDLEGWWRALGVTSIVAVSLAQANLLLLLAGRGRATISAALAATLGAIAVVASMLLMLVFGVDWAIDGDAFWRVFGVAAILDALGTIALPILGLVLRRAPAEVPAATPVESVASDGSVRLRLELPPMLASRVDAAAAAAGVTREQLVLDTLAGSVPPLPPR